MSLVRVADVQVKCQCGELQPEATLRKFRRVQREGEREVAREIEFYNLDAIISVGYRYYRVHRPHHDKSQ